MSVNEDEIRQRHHRSRPMMKLTERELDTLEHLAKAHGPLLQPFFADPFIELGILAERELAERVHAREAGQV